MDLPRNSMSKQFHSMLGVVARKRANAGGVSVEGFEGVGIPDGWSLLGNSPDWDNESVVLSGTKSVEFAFNESANTPTRSAESEIWYRFRIYWDVDTAANLRFLDATGFRIFIKSGNTMRVQHGGVNLDVSLAAATHYRVKIRYVASSGANDGVCEVYIDTTDTFGAADATTSVGAATVKPTTEIVGNENQSNTALVYLDDWSVTTTDPGDF